MRSELTDDRRPKFSPDLRLLKWSGKTGQRPKMYSTMMTGYTNDEEFADNKAHRESASCLCPATIPPDPLIRSLNRCR